MSSMPVMKRCRKCGRIWFWNPSVNQIACPYCMGKRSDLLDVVSKAISKIVSRTKR